MDRQDKTGLLGGLGETSDKAERRERRSPQDCGDVGLKIGRDGTWYYQDSPIGRRPLVKLFASVLRQEDDGQYYLVTPAEKALVRVEDAPFLAVAMEIKGSGRRQRLIFRTNLEETVEAGPDHPMSFRPAKGGSFTPYLLVRAGLTARLTRPVYYDLVATAVSADQGGKTALGVWSGGDFFPFPETSI
jgi:hypothetical protein